jgi:hypothetical protein
VLKWGTLGFRCILYCVRSTDFGNSLFHINRFMLLGISDNTTPRAEFSAYSENVCFLICYVFTIKNVFQLKLRTSVFAVFK